MIVMRIAYIVISAICLILFIIVLFVPSSGQWNSRFRVCEGMKGEVVRLMQISDLHIGKHQDIHSLIVDDVNRLRPDFILFTGDLIDDQDNVVYLESFLEAFPSTVTMYAVPGNWEHWANIDFKLMDGMFRRWHGRWLVNDSVLITVRGSMFLLVGLDDFTGGRPNLPLALSHAPRSWDGRNLLVLAHSPGERERLLANSRQLATRTLLSATCSWMLSGHTHGGGVVVMGVPLTQTSGSGGYLKGWYREGGVPMYVSRGIGDSVLPFRLGAPPELPYFEWELGGGER
ncbi:MAG: metallophosphoesterase [Magnetococcales bacterium]|nr:metallophosphoesterase [Magnetococcales bacterium]